MEEFTLRANDGIQLAVTIAEAQETRALVHIIHGAKEHRKRYYPFMEYLRAHGYTVSISDNRGHGESINADYPLGYMDGFEKIIDDQKQLMEHVKERYPKNPVYVFGHSLGSVFARCYLQQYDTDVQKMVLSGTVNYVPGIGAGILLGKGIRALTGKHGYNKFLEQLSFKNQKGDLWISASAHNLENYRKDPLCQYQYQNNAVITMLRAVKELHHVKAFACKNPTLPILSISGEEDPITGGEKGLQDSIQSLRKIGYEHVDKIVYPGMKHEVLHEDEKEIVYKDVLEFLQTP